MTIKFTYKQNIDLIVGCSVKIKTNLQVYTNYGKSNFIPQMKRYCGKTAKITKINKYKTFHISIDDGYWVWSKEMVDPI